IPPPAVRALLEARRLTRYDKSQRPVDVGLELVAAAREDDKRRLLLRALVKLPVLFVAQRDRRQPVGAGDLVVVGDDGVAGNVEVSGHGAASSPEVSGSGLRAPGLRTAHK